MDDLISRQAAIDALKRDEALVRAFGYQHAIDAIQELPSAQPEITQNDIELYCKQRCLTVITNELFCEMKTRWAQPEIVRCKDCKHNTLCFSDVAMTNRMQTSTVYEHIDFCSYGERKTDG